MRFHPRTLTVALALLVTLLPLAAAARPADRSPDEQRAMLVRLLGDKNLELDRRFLDPIGDDVPHQLVLIADLPSIRALVRVRALAALGLYPTVVTRRYLTGVLNEPDNAGSAVGTRLRQQALRSLGVGFGPEAVDDILAHRRDRAPAIRMSVANALGDARDPRVLPTLEQWLGAEPDLTVRAAIDDAISKLRGR
ncbi:MAG: HEAT repeat domain-containing protein [Deltaproteobacteria bacterium]|nr:MAG: HEAT repeat domain-containing protein [Deltaproteobacteria bacterium]